MKVTIESDQGMLVGEWDLQEVIAEAAKEFPDDSRETHIEIAKGEVAEEVSAAIEKELVR